MKKGEKVILSSECSSQHEEALWQFDETCDELIQQFSVVESFTPLPPSKEEGRKK